MLKAVIFDMDGVLIDSEPVHMLANKLTMEKINVPFSEEYFMQYIGTTCGFMWNKIIKDFNLFMSVEQLEEISSESLKSIIKKSGYPTVKGVVALIKSLYNKNITLAVASSSDENRIVSVLKSMGVSEYFQEIVSGTQVENPKPAPDTFLAAADKLKISPEECVVIEDSELGIEAAKRAGMICIGFEGSGYPQDTSKADYIVQGFEEINFKYVEMIYCHSKNQPWTPVETQRLYAREITLNDLDRLYEIYSEPCITKYTEDLYKARKDEEEFTKSYIENMYKFYGYGMYVVCLKENDLVIGRAGIENKETDGENHLQLGYVIAKDYQKKGYGTEICEGLIEFGKEFIKAKELECIVDMRNKASIALAEKLGFKRKGLTEINKQTHFILAKSLRE